MTRKVLLVSFGILFILSFACHGFCSNFRIPDLAENNKTLKPPDRQIILSNSIAVSYQCLEIRFLFHSTFPKVF